MPPKKKTAVEAATLSPANPAGQPYLTLVKAPTGGYVVLKATLVGREVLGFEVLAGPMARASASAALRVEMARAFLIGKGPQ